MLADIQALIEENTKLREQIRVLQERDPVLAAVEAVRAATAEVDMNIDCAEVTRCFKEAVLTPKHTRNKKEQA